MCADMRRLSGMKEVLATGLLSLLAMVATSCATRGQPQAVAPVCSSPTLPVVVSGMPRHDALVMQESDRQLETAQWDKLEKRGPKPVWQKDKDGKSAELKDDEKGTVHVIALDREAPASTQPSA